MVRRLFLNVGLGLLCLAPAAMLSANHQPSAGCRLILSRNGDVGAEFATVLQERIAALQNTPQPSVLLIGTAWGTETAMTVAYSQALGLKDIRIDSLETNDKHNQVARYLMADMLQTQPLAVQVHTRDASSPDSYSDLATEYKLVVLRHPHLLEDFLNQIEKPIIQNHWIGILEQSLKRLSRRHGRMLMSFYTFNELEYAQKLLAHYPFASQLEWKVAYVSEQSFGSDSHILEVWWKP